MYEIPILGSGDEAAIFKQFLAQYDVPAYVRRALRVEEAGTQLLNRCRRQRHEWLALVRVRLGLLQQWAGDWNALRPWLRDDGQIQVLRQLHGLVEPKLRVQVPATSSVRVLQRGLRELIESIQRFNARWAAYLPKVDLTKVNQLRDGYNRYYLLEKECAVRSSRLARMGYTRLEPLTVEQLTAWLPPLPVPELKP